MGFIYRRQESAHAEVGSEPEMPEALYRRDG